MKENVKAILVGLFLSFCLLFCLEIFFRWNNVYGWLDSLRGNDQITGLNKNLVLNYLDLDEKKSLEIKDQIKNHPIMSWRHSIPFKDAQKIKGNKSIDESLKGHLICCLEKEKIPPAGTIRSIALSRDRKHIIYDVRVTTDSFGLRKTPNPSAHSQDIFLFGDSFTLGQGVNDEESFPYQLGKFRPNAKVLNFGVSGGGPGEFYYELNQKPHLRLNRIKSRRPVAIYTYTFDHMDRLVCRSLCSRKGYDWRLTKPFFQKRGDSIEYKGSFLNRSFLNSFYGFLHESSFVNFFNIVIPPRFMQKDFDFFAQVMKDSELILEKKFGSVDFYVAFFPGYSGVYTPQLIAASKRHNLKILDYSRIDPNLIADGHHHITGDAHPSPISHLIYAFLLHRDLPQ